MNKDVLIEKGTEKGIDKKILENEYDRLLNFAKKLGNEGEEAEAYALRMLKRFIKKALLNPIVKLNGFIIGYRFADFGEIMRRKYGDYYPEEHFNSGKLIPEHDYNLTFFVLLEDKNELITFSVKGDDALEMYENKEIKVGYKYQIILKQGYKEGVYLWDKSISSFENETKVEDLRKYIIEKMKSYVVKDLKSLQNMESNSFVLIKADTIVDMRLSFDDYIIYIDDESLELEDKSISIRILSDLVNFNENAQSVVFVAQVARHTEDAVELQGLLAIPREEDIINKEKIDSEDADNIDDEIEKFLN